ncbi:fasciclin-3 isoform X1 [Aphidius gifuensis]|uniref:fasciclin-3 isoform X1 n=1 Tax=Aphidius gifuensis TaxID=684658 RepID=UPI001CDD63F4|nr:fasciclin-3 isoform X1 [Aphidius gifuensis]
MAMMMKNKGESFKMFFWSCLILCLGASVQGAGLKVEMELSAPVVREGGNLTIRCWTANTPHSCIINPPNKDYVSLTSGFKNATKDGVNYDGSNLERGECIARIPFIEEKHNGNWTCDMSAGLHSGLAVREVVVAKAPGQPQLELSRTEINSKYPYTYRKGETMIITCSVKTGRPAANISIYLGDELLPEENKPSYNNGVQDNSQMTRGTAKRTMQVNDNNKEVKCIANHVALKNPLESIKQRVEVWYEPQPIEEHPIQHYGFRIGHVETIKVEIDANPQPEFVWSVNNQEIKVGPYQNQRMRVLPIEPVGNGFTGKWLAQLEIDSVQKSDTENEYTLVAKNYEGTAAPYRIKISTSTEPERGQFAGLYERLSASIKTLASTTVLGSGFGAVHIVGIVVAALALCLLVFIGVFARATGRWCFADGSTRNIGESSDTESAGRYSRSEVDNSSGNSKKPRIIFSQLFRRNKDKVSGTDTDTMRTVVNVDDEKIPETIDVTQKINPCGLVYAELDLTQKELVSTPRRVSDDKTEYAEILYTKTEDKDTK